MTNMFIYIHVYYSTNMPFYQIKHWNKQILLCDNSVVKGSDLDGNGH